MGMNARPRARAFVAALLLLPSLVLILALALLTSPRALASSTTRLPELPGRSIPLLKTAEPMKDKKVAQPTEPEVDCVREVTGDDRMRARNADFAAGTGGEAKNLGKCLPQNDAFRRAGEAASYLGHYYTNFTPFAAEIRKMEKDGTRGNFHEAIRQCITNDPACDQEKQRTLLKALVQYNFGKELKGQVLANNARAERMKTASAELPAQYWKGFNTNAQRVMTHRGALKTGSLRTSTFRLDATKDYVLNWDKLSASQQAALGNNFMNEYRNFVDNYTKTTQLKSRWHYVPAKSSALMGSTFKAADDFRSQDAKRGTLAIDENRQKLDMRSQDTQKVNEIVYSYRKSMQEDSVRRRVKNPDTGKEEESRVSWVGGHPGHILQSEVGFGLIQQEEKGERVDPKVVAQGLILSINKAIVDTEDNMAKKNAAARSPSAATGASAPPPKVIPSVSVDVEKFDKFLDAIWPADVAKP